MTNEFWKIVEDHPNYMISDQGRLMNIKRGRIIKGSIHRDGYHRYCLSTNGKCRSVFAHQLVAEAFIPNPDNLPEVNHIDEVKTHNYPSNLEWTTRKGNMWHSRFANAETYKVQHPDGHVEVTHNLSEFCREHNLNVGNLHKGITKGWSHKGFKLLEKV